MRKDGKLIGAAESDPMGVALRAQARAAGAAAMEALVALTTGASTDAVKLAAIKELLDRGFGRAAQGDSAGTMIVHLVIDDGYPG